MPEFQKTLQQPTVGPSPKLQISGGSLAGDVVQGASFLFDVYQRNKQIEQAEAFQNKQRAYQDTLDRLINLESDLIAQGRSPFQVNEKLRKAVEALPTSEDRNVMRGALAKFRGTTLVAEQQELTQTKEEIETQNIEDMYQDLKRVAPSFALLYNKDNTLESKKETVNLWKEQTAKSQLIVEEKEKALNMANKDAITASDRFSDAMHREIAIDLNNGFNSFVQALEAIDPEDKEGIAELQKVKRRVFETANILKSNITKEYSVMSRGIPPKGDSKLYMDDQKQALLTQVDNITDLLQKAEYSELKTFTNQLKALETQYQLDALQAGDFISRMNAKYGQLVTNTLSQRVITQDLGLGRKFREGVTSSLESLTGSTSLAKRVNNLESLSEGITQTFEQDTQGYSDFMSTLKNNNLNSMAEVTKDAIFKSTTNYLKSATRQTNIVNPMELIKQITSPKFRSLFSEQDRGKKEEFAVAAKDYTLRVLNDPKQGLSEDLAKSSFGAEISVENGRLKIIPIRREIVGREGISLQDTRFLEGVGIVEDVNYLIENDIISVEDINFLRREEPAEIETDYSSFEDGTYEEDGKRFIIQDGVRIDE